MTLVRLAFAWLMLVLVAPAPANAEEYWIESWGTPLPLMTPPPPRFAAGPPPDANAPPPAVPSPVKPFPAQLEDQTVRMIFRVSAGGERLRLEFANALDAQPVLLDRVHVALSDSADVILPETGRTVTFRGKGQLVLRPGAKVVSDPVELALPALSKVAVSIYLPRRAATDTVDPLALMPVYVADGEQTAARQLAEPSRADAYFWLKGLSVPAADENTGTIVALGDSITEGYATTSGANASWPDQLAERLQSDPELSHWGVVNAGISGNRVLKTGVGDPAVARFGDDVLARPGVKWVVVLEGINDINMSIMPGMAAEQAVTAAEIIAGLDQLIARAHLNGIKVAGGTILATKGLPFYSAEGEAMRRAVNDWIRHSGRFDAVIDFDAATRDSADPRRLLPEIDPGDHVHPNDAGNRLMAEAIDLEIFKRDE